MTKSKITIIIVICIAIFVAVLSLELFFDSSAENISSLRSDIVKSTLSALISTALLGTITTIIANDVVKIRKNDNKLKEYGINDIGTGKSSFSDERAMFGCPITNNVPKQLDLMFLSGNGFLKTYKKELIRIINNGCNVRILLVSPLVNGKPNEYIIRYGNLCEPDEPSLAYQICCNSLSIIKEIENAAEGASGSIKLRTYIDEFRNNQRFATYMQRNKKLSAHQNIKYIKCLINFQASTVIARDLSLLLRGTIVIDDLKTEKLKSNVQFYARI